MINVYDLGDVVTVTASFDPTPTTVALIVNSPSGTISNPSVTPPGEGSTTYTSYIEASEAGTWYYEWKSTGTGQAAEQGQFLVRNTNAPEPA
jgi:hypothetical protein